MPALGALLCIASAAAFGAMGIFGTLAYDEGATLGTLLAVRFSLAAALFWILAACTGAARGLRTLTRRDLAIGLVLGAVIYSAQAGAYFAGLQRIDVSLLSLLLYTFPAIVTVAAIVLGRERASARRFAALGLASAGLVLVVAGAGTGAMDPLGALLGLTAAVVFSTYILGSAEISGRVHPLLLSALVCTGAAATLSLVSAAAGELRLGDLSTSGFGWLTALAIVSTVAAIGLFFAGLRRVGPTTAAILGTAEPLTAVLLAGVVFGESLGPAQVAGAALIVAAAVLLSLQGARKAPRAIEGTAG